MRHGGGRWPISDKTTNGVLRRCVWLGSDLAVEADTNWNVLASYFYQPGVDAPVSRTDNAGSTVPTRFAGTRLMDRGQRDALPPAPERRRVVRRAGAPVPGQRLL